MVRQPPSSVAFFSFMYSSSTLIGYFQDLTKIIRERERDVGRARSGRRTGHRCHCSAQTRPSLRGANRPAIVESSAPPTSASARANSGDCAARVLRAVWVQLISIFMYLWMHINARSSKGHCNISQCRELIPSSKWQLHLYKSKHQCYHIIDHELHLNIHQMLLDIVQLPLQVSFFIFASELLDI